MAEWDWAMSMAHEFLRTHPNTKAITDWGLAEEFRKIERRLRAEMQPEPPPDDTSLPLV